MFDRLACFICVSVALAAAADQTGPEPADLGALLDAGYGAMVTLVAGDTRLVAHRAVLARSPVWAEAFRRDPPEAGSGQLSVDGVEGAVLRQLLSHLYTLQPPRLPAMAPQLLAAADTFRVAALKEECERQVIDQLSVESAAAAAVLAVSHDAPALRRAALAFIRAHTHDVLATRGWKEAVRAQPEAIIKVSQLLNDTSEAGVPTPAAVDDTTNAAGGVGPSPGDVDASTIQSLTAEEKGKRLIEAAKKGALEEVRALLQARADVGAKDDKDATALHWAALQGHVESARLLLTAGADPNARAQAAWTPLHFAAHRGHREVAEALLDTGADRVAINSGGDTPLDVAKKAGHQPLVELLA